MSSEVRTKDGYEAVPQAAADVLVAEEPRQWHGHWLDCCGVYHSGCSLFFWKHCLVTKYLPCVSFGLTARRAFSSSAWIQGLFVLSLLMTGYVWYSTEMALETGGCMLDPPDLQQLAKYHYLPRRMGYQPGGAAVGPVVPLLNHGPVDSSNPECVRLVHSANWLYALALLSAIVLAVYGAYRRTQMREKFGIPGSRAGDCLLWWFCKPCAMCQEARTVEYNNVHDGVWHGPTLPVVFSTETQTTVPAVPVMSAAAADAAARKL